MEEHNMNDFVMVDPDTVDPSILEDFDFDALFREQAQNRAGSFEARLSDASGLLAAIPAEPLILGEPGQNLRQQSDQSELPARPPLDDIGLHDNPSAKTIDAGQYRSDLMRQEPASGPHIEPSDDPLGLFTSSSPEAAQAAEYQPNLQQQLNHLESKPIFQTTNNNDIGDGAATLHGTEDAEFRSYVSRQQLPMDFRLQAPKKLDGGAPEHVQALNASMQSSQFQGQRINLTQLDGPVDPRLEAQNNLSTPGPQQVQSHFPPIDTPNNQGLRNDLMQHRRFGISHAPPEQPSPMQQRHPSTGGSYSFRPQIPGPVSQPQQIPHAHLLAPPEADTDTLLQTLRQQRQQQQHQQLPPQSHLSPVPRPRASIAFTNSNFGKPSHFGWLCSKCHHVWPMSSFLIVDGVSNVHTWAQCSCGHVRCRHCDLGPVNQVLGPTDWSMLAHMAVEHRPGSGERAVVETWHGRGAVAWPENWDPWWDAEIEGPVRLMADLHRRRMANADQPS